MSGRTLQTAVVLIVALGALSSLWCAPPWQRDGADLRLEAGGSLRNAPRAPDEPLRFWVRIEPGVAIVPESIELELLLDDAGVPMARGADGLWHVELPQPERGCDFRINVLVRYRRSESPSTGREQREPPHSSWLVHAQRPVHDVRFDPAPRELCPGESAVLRATPVDALGCRVHEADVELSWKALEVGAAAIRIEPHPVDANARTVTGVEPGALEIVSRARDVARVLPLAVRSGADCAAR